MMNMSPAILNYTVKFNQTVAAVQYNDTNSSFSSLHCVFISRSLRFITPESPSLLQLRFSSLRCDGFLTIFSLSLCVCCEHTAVIVDVMCCVCDVSIIRFTCDELLSYIIKHTAAGI